MVAGPDERDVGDISSADAAARVRRLEALRRIADGQLGADTPDGGALARAAGPERAPAASYRAAGRRGWLVLIGALVAVLLVVVGVILVPRLGPFPATGRATPAATSALTGAGACVRANAHPRPPYQNVRASHDAFLAHSEPMLAEDPANPLHLVGGSKFFTDPARYRFQIGTFASFDGGCTWSDGGVLPGFARTVITSDISLAFGTHGEVYVAVLHDAQGGQSGLSVSTSTDGGRTFAAPVDVYSNAENRIFSDKPWMTVDWSNGPHRGALDVVWSYQYGGDCGFGNACHQEIAFAQSSDGGKSFSPPKLIEGSAPFCTNPAKGRAPDATLCDAAQGPIPLVTADGTLAVAFAYEDLVDDRIPTRLLVVASRDGGATWQPPALAATVPDVAGFFPPNRYRNVTLPAFAASPDGAALYLAWADKRNGTADVFFASSKDGGATWSPSIRVNDDASHTGSYHFQPQLAVAPGGVVTICWFDTRNDPQHRLIDVYLAQSSDSGASFLPNVRVTTTSWDPAVDAPVDGGGAQFIGDYQGLAADDQFVHPFWNDTRTGAQEIFTAAVPSVSARHP